MPDFEAFEAVKVEGDELQLELLVASRRALLQPERRAKRLDIIVSSLLAVLGGRGSLTRDALRQAVESLWKTGSITAPVFDGALDAAEIAGLVVLQPGLDEKPRYDIAASVKAELERDRDWVTNTLDDLRTEVADRLLEYPDEDLRGREDKVTSLIVRAVARALVGYDIAAPAAEEVLMPLEIDEGSIVRFAKSVNPKSHRAPVRDLAFAALDPDDEFGNEIVHLIVSGQVLHGIVTQRGGDPGQLKGVKLLVDTSVLTNLTADDSPERDVLIRAIETSIDVGAEVYVAQHTVEEWNRQWEIADDEARAITGNTIPILASRFEQNPFLRSYLRAAPKPEELPYTKWAAPRRNLPETLRGLGVEVIRHGITSETNVGLVETIRKALLETGRRTERAAEADAYSAIMVAKWRAEHGPNTAYFLAAERFTGEAFRTHVDPKHSLVVSPHAWLVYASNLGIDDPDTAADLADLIANTMIRRTMLELASTYTFEEVLSLSEILMDSGNITARDVREMGLPELFDLDELAESELSADQRAARLLREKAKREAARARRMQSQADQATKVARADSERAARTAEAERKRREELETELAVATEKLNEESARANSEVGRSKLIARRFVVGILIAVLAIATWAGHTFGRWPGWITLLSAAVIVLVILRSREFLTNPDEGMSGVALVILGEIALIGVGLAIELMGNG